MSTRGQKTVHPFFTRGQDHAPSAAVNGLSHPSDVPETEDPDHSEAIHTPRSTAKKGKPKSEATRRTQRTLKPLVNTRPDLPSDIVANLPTPELEANGDPRKRRRLSRDSSVSVGASHDVSTPDVVNAGRTSPQVIVTASQLHSATHTIIQSDAAEVVAPVAQQSPVKKQLRLNASGRFCSPPANKADQSAEVQEPRLRRGEPRKAKTAYNGPPQSIVVVCAYGKDDASRCILAERVTGILSGACRVQVERPSPKKRTPRPAKTTHPFFEKPKPKSDQVPPKRDSPPKSSAVTPGKLRKQTETSRVQDTNETASLHTSALLKDHLMIRVPGAKEAPFPSREQAHVRGPRVLTVISTLDSSFSRRKHKQACLPFPQDQSILKIFAASLEPDGGPVLRPDGFREPSLLHVPDRMLIPGEEIVETIQRQLSISLDTEQDELQCSSSARPPHAALLGLCSMIPRILTAFDEIRGEPLMWAQKYAPRTVVEVLQPSEEMLVLKDWLKSLSVQAVGGSTATQDKSKAVEKPKKRRKRKSDDLDDFVVDSDDDVRSMNNLKPGEAGPWHRVSQASVVEDVYAGAKLSNAVLLSGPTGCGKTAAAYAVAKELGFKVFEISSSERRSGKDVLDKVGNMTENHLVKHHGTEADTIAKEPDHIEEAFQRDLQSGRQGNLNNFFRQQALPKPKTKPAEAKMKEAATVAAVQEAMKKPSKDQQQSLILLEEVDILFKDDKDFWTTILKLIATSKRPCIMTCNDEDLVPLQAMSLHAVLRFTKTPLDLATDYMLLVAAAEGHLLQRAAIASLYESKNSDLRASMIELNFWCQMGVGDPRGGLGWLYQRWPPGSDIDKQGRKIRVASSGTYQQGMGALPPPTTPYDESLLWAWNEFDIEPHAACGWDTSAVLNDEPDSGTRPRRLQQSFALIDALSAADVSCSLPHTAPFDTTQPELSDKARAQYVDQIALLQTDDQVDHTDFTKQLLVAMTTLAFGNDDDAFATTTTAAILPSATRQHGRRSISRRDLACFDAISVPKESSSSGGSSLLQSAFDGPMTTIATDLAPYVRSIVQFDQALEEQRARLETSDGRKSKRGRTTRAARSALEGGQRASTRREKWFTGCLDMEAVLATGGKDWPRSAQAFPLEAASPTGSEGSNAPTPSAETI